MGLNGGIDLTGLINTDGLEKKLDPAIEKLDAIINMLDNLAGKKSKIEFDVSGVKDMSLLNDSLEKLDKKIKAPKQKMAYFQSIENATIDMKKSWNDFVKSFNDGKISSDKLYDNNAATKVLRYANAFEALGGNISNVSPEISEFIDKMRSIDDYTQSRGYNFTVTGFKEAFDEFEKIRQQGINFNGFDVVKKDISQLLTLSIETGSAIQNIGGQIGSSFNTDSGSMNGAIEGQHQYQEELKKTREEIVLTEEQMKKQLMSSYNNNKKGDVDEWDVFWNLDMTDDNLSDIEKYSKAIDELKRKQQDALIIATDYQNRIAEAKNSGKEPKEHHVSWIQKYVQDYYKYTEQIEFMQEKLQTALKNYTPNADGNNAQAINALVLLLQNLNEQIEKIRISFGSIDDNSDVPNLLTSIQELKKGITDTVIEIGKLSEAFSGMNFNVSINAGSGENSIQKMSEYGDSARQTTKVLQEAFSELQSITGFSLNNNGIKYLTKDAKDLIYEIEKINNLELTATTGKVDGKTNIKQQNIALQELIELYKKAASYAGIDLSSWTKKYNSNINKSIENTQKILTGEKQAEDASRQLSSLFGNVNNITLEGLTTEIDKVIAKLQEMMNLLSAGLDIKSTTSAINGQNGLNSEIVYLESLKNKILEVKNAILLKNYEFAQEEKIVSSSVQSEIKNLQLLDDNLKVILETLRLIQETPINLNIVGIDSNTNSTENTSKIITDLKNSLNGLDPSLLKNLSSLLSGLIIDESVATNIQKLANAILNLKSNLNNVSPSSTEFLNSIKELVSQGAALQNLVDVLNATDEKLNNAKKAIDSSGSKKNNNVDDKTFDIPRESKEWEIIKTKALEYKDVLGDIQKITYSMRQDKDKKQLKSYKVTGSKSSITLGENLNLVAQKETQIYKKTAEELEKIRNDFISSAKKADFSFDLSSLKVDQNGIITFTSIIEKAGEEAVITKYKIEDLNEALNKNGSLNNEYLNNHSIGKFVKEDDLIDKMASGREKSNLKALNSERKQELNQAKAINKALEDEYIKNQKEQLNAEKELQSQREQFNKSNINGIDLLIKKREEEARLFSSTLKAQMESEQKLVEQMASVREKSEVKSQQRDRSQELAQAKAINREQEKEFNQKQKNIKADEKQLEISKKKALSYTYSASRRLKNAISNYSYGDASEATSMIEQLQKGENIFGNYSNVEENIRNLTTVIDKIISDLNSSHKQSLNGLNEEIKAEENLQRQKDDFNKKNLNAIDYEIKKREESAKLFSSTLKADMQDRYNRIDNTTVDKSLQQTKQLMDDIFGKKQNISGFKDVFDRAQKKVDELNNKLKNGQISDVKTGYTDKVSKIVNDLNKVVAVVNPYDIQSAQQAMSDYIKDLNNGKVEVGDFSKENKVLTASFEQQKGVLREVALVYDEVSGSISVVDKGTKKVKSSLTRFVDGIKTRFKSLVQYLAIFASYYRIIGYIKQGITVVRDLDTALTEMRKVSDETVESLKNFQGISFDIAKSVGTTAKQIQNSTADWMRLGESLEEAAESARVTSVLLNVSEFEGIDEATDSLVAMSAAYSDLSKSDIVDKLNEVGNNYAISTDGLASALQKSASALTTAGNDMDEAVALITAGNQIAQDPDSVGAGLRTIALRITGTKEAKKELEELGEDVDDFTTHTASKLQNTIKNFTKVESNNFKGFDILDDNGNYKSTYEILLGISEIYEEIIETDKRYGSNMANGLLETLAGKNRSNIAASILQNPDILKSVYESSAYDSEGSAQEELDKYLDSIEGKIQLFTNRVQEFWYNLIDSEIVKEFVDAGTELINILDNILSGLNESGTIKLISVFLSSVIKGISKLTDGLGVLNTALAGVFGTLLLTKGKNSGGRAKYVYPQK